MDIHCVVTGQNESGKSVIIASGEAIPSLNFRRTGLRHRSLAISPPRMVSASVSSPYRRIQERASIRSAHRLLSKKFSRSCRG